MDRNLDITLTFELKEITSRVKSAANDESARKALPPAFAEIDWSDADELSDALFEAIVETVAAAHGFDDERIARLGLLADQVIDI
ncbi:MAG: hypothetical protein LBB86_06320 [Oscillospiraceae bacterium]|jgi:hypothetical protein|nr:hypothetical protein [Oscillospiraceae bacterium]